MTDRMSISPEQGPQMITDGPFAGKLGATILFPDGQLKPAVHITDSVVGHRASRDHLDKINTGFMDAFGIETQIAPSIDSATKFAPSSYRLSIWATQSEETLRALNGESLQRLITNSREDNNPAEKFKRVRTILREATTLTEDAQP